MKLAKRSGTPSLVNLFTATSALGQKRPRDAVRLGSALPRTADLDRQVRQVRLGPQSDSCTATNNAHGCNESIYSITSSARASSIGGTSRPSALAVLRLITNSNLVGCSTGMSAGFVPRRTLSTSSAERRNRSAKFGP